MGKCKNCGTELSEGVTTCPFCGKEAENVVIDDTQVAPKKKKKIGKSIIISILAVAVGSVVGELIADNIFNNNQKEEVNSVIEEIDSFIENLNNYTPGYFDGNEYTSEEFGFKFVTDENWEHYSEEELEIINEGPKESGLQSALALLQEENVPQELQDKFVESFYVATEMGALYISDEMYVGEVTIGVISAFGAETMTAEDYLTGVKDNAKSSGAYNSQISDKVIDGNTYKVLTIQIEADGIKMTNKMYTRIKDNIICMITCKAIEGYEDEVFSALEAAMAPQE